MDLLKMIQINKSCSKCKQIKLINEFTKRKDLKDGLSGRCKECDKSYYLKDKQKKLKQCREYALKNVNRVKEHKRKCYLKNKDKYLILQKKRRQYNKTELRSYYRKYQKERSNSDPNYKLARNLRRRLHDFLSGKLKTISAVKDLGCTINELKLHIESKFQDGMSWSNYGIFGWHIDHIRPLSNFNLLDKNEALKAVHYTNLQPLWAKDNLSKGAKYV